MGGENRSDSREGKKLKNHDSLALEHLTSHVLPREASMFSETLSSDKEQECAEGHRLGQTFPRCFAGGLGERDGEDA